MTQAIYANFLSINNLAKTLNDFNKKYCRLKNHCYLCSVLVY